MVWSNACAIVEQDELKRCNLSLEAEKRELSDLVDKKNKEIDRLQGTYMYFHRMCSLVLLTSNIIHACMVIKKLVATRDLMFRFGRRLLAEEYRQVSAQVADAGRLKIEAVTEKDRVLSDFVRVEVHAHAPSCGV